MARKDGDRSPSLGRVAVMAALAGGALFGTASTVVVMLRPHSVLLSAGLSVAVALGYALIALWLCLVLRRLGRFGGTADGGGGEGWGRQRQHSTRPQPPSDGLDFWPEFERELRAYLETQEREPVAS